MISQIPDQPCDSCGTTTWDQYKGTCYMCIYTEYSGDMKATVDLVIAKEELEDEVQQLKRDNQLLMETLGSIQQIAKNVALITEAIAGKYKEGGS